MSDLQDLIDQWDNSDLAARAYPETFIAGFLEAARRVATPDLDLAHRFDTIRVGGPTADSRVHLNGSLSGDEWGRLQTALGITEDAQ